MPFVLYVEYGLLVYYCARRKGKTLWFSTVYRPCFQIKSERHAKVSGSSPAWHERPFNYGDVDIDAMVDQPRPPGPVDVGPLPKKRELFVNKINMGGRFKERQAKRRQSFLVHNEPRMKDQEPLATVPIRRCAELKRRRSDSSVRSTPEIRGSLVAQTLPLNNFEKRIDLLRDLCRKAQKSTTITDQEVRKLIQVFKFELTKEGIVFVWKILSKFPDEW